MPQSNQGFTARRSFQSFDTVRTASDFYSPPKAPTQKQQGSFWRDYGRPIALVVGGLVVLGVAAYQNGVKKAPQVEGLPAQPIPAIAPAVVSRAPSTPAPTPLPLPVARAQLVKLPVPKKGDMLIYHNLPGYGDWKVTIKGVLRSASQLPKEGFWGDAYLVGETVWFWAQPRGYAYATWIDP
jgi:hypothetical protein